MMREKIELLAPAGNEDALRAAVQSGADAVYIGGPKFGARRSAKNFSIESIKQQADYCHLYGVDLHVAVNTLIKEKELGEVVDYVRELNDAGVDALIIQDIGAAELIHKTVPDMALHASTQMTVTSLEGVKYLEDMGFSRVVLARELNAREIEKICRGARAEIEVFAHGAICMCYSGQCLMSSILGGRSGNRGMCAQPCRLPYTLLEKGKPVGNAYLLSPKDMALINDLQELKDIGVTSLKIEGRLKRAEYVSAVVGVYRKYLDDTRRASKEDMRELHDAFSRTGFTDGYFTGHLGEQMMSHKNPGNGDNSFTDEAKRRAAPDANIRKIPVSISGRIYTGEPVTVTVFDNDGNCAEANGSELVREALSRSIDDERLRAQLAKTGATPYEAMEVYTDIDNKAGISVKEINSVRREALDRLTQLRMKRSLGRSLEVELPKRSQSEKPELKLSAEVSNIEQAKAALKHGIELIYAPPETAAEISKLKTDENTEIVVKTRDIFAPEKLAGQAAAVSSNAAIYYYRKKYPQIRLYGTHRLNIFNAQTAEHYKALSLVTVSPELNLHEIHELSENTDTPLEVIGYGRIPLMLMKNCPVKAAGRCQKHKNIYSLRDRKNEEFPILCSQGCIAQLINSKPVFMADKLQDLNKLKISYVKLIFTVENFSQCDKIIGMYQNALNGNISKLRENTFTRGHYYRGVE